MNTLGERVRALRLAKGLTLEQLSTLSMVEVNTISALENRRSQRSAYAGRLARALGVKVEDLVKDDMPEHVVRERAATYSGWPLPGIDADKLHALPRDDQLRLQGAILVAARLLGLDIQSDSEGEQT